MTALLFVLTALFLVTGWAMLALRGGRFDVVDAWYARRTPHTTGAAISRR